MVKKLPKETPVYLCFGFLEGGKTKFMQETMEDPRFADSGEKTLVLVCEEGEVEYEPKKFATKNFVIKYITDEAELTEAKLSGLQLEFGIERVFIEYNGMWLLQTLFNAMPDGWMLAQVMTFFDSTTFLSYNANMRQLVYDKLQYAQMVVFNRFNPSKMNKEEFHKVVRAVTRRADIIYEDLNGKTELDDIEDPLPYDINAPLIDIADRDYAFFYRDLAENTGNYGGKKVRFKGLVACDKRLEKGSFVIGRYVMTCCEADIQYSGLACESDGSVQLSTKDWVIITAVIENKFHKIYRGKGPVLKVEKIERSEEPEQSLATFY